MIESLHSRLVYPSIMRLIGENAMYGELARLEALQYQSNAEVLESQSCKLAEILNYSNAHSPYYRGRLGAGGRVDSGEALAALRDLPFLTKEDLQTRFEELTADPGPARISRKTTGGSTGQPVTVIKDAQATAKERAATWLAYGWFGIRPGDRGARFWGSPRALGGRRLRYALADLAMNRIRFSAFGVSESDLEDYWTRCLAFRPRYFYGYVSMIEAFARFVQATGRRGARLGLRAIITTSEILTDSQRSLFEATFAAPVQNEYGCGEVGPIAYECECGGMHEMSDNVLVEIVDADGRPVSPGEEGEIVVTDLNNRALPLLRYRLHDRAVREADCVCDRGFPVLGSVRGRTYDQVVAPDGRLYHGEFFMYLFEDIRDSGVRFDRFRVVQEGSTELFVQVQAAEEHASALQGAVRKAVLHALPEMTVSVEVVPAIELPKSGKLRIVENRSASREF